MTRVLRNKIIASVLSFFAVAAVTAVFCVIGVDFSDNGNAGDTFVGSVSARAYSSKDNAARAFVENELGGATVSPSYVGYNKTGELDVDEIERLNGLGLTDDVILGGEKNEIEYVPNVTTDLSYGDTAGAKNASATDVEVKTAKARSYLLETGSGYRYYVPLPEAGEPVTNAYLSAVLSGANYLNCTSTSTVHVRILDIDNTYRQVIRFADDKAFFKQELPGLVSDVYLAEHGGGLTAYIKHPNKNDDRFYTIAEINRDLANQGLKYELDLVKGGDKIPVAALETMRDVTDFAFMITVDASFFVKTKTGFSMPNDKYIAVCRSMLGEEAFEAFDMFREEHKVHFRSDYTVSGGKLVKSETVLNMVYDDDIFVLAVKSAYSAFGTTEVEIPAGEESA